MIDVIRLPIFVPGSTPYLVLAHVQGFNLTENAEGGDELPVGVEKTLSIQVNGELMEFSDPDFIKRFMSQMVDNT